MQVDVLRSTDHPERLVCQAGRGDYSDGYVGDTEYWDLMEPVDYDEEYVSIAEDMLRSKWERWPDVRQLSTEEQAILEAKTKAFVEQQLDRGHYGLWEHPSITLAVEGVSRVTMAQLTRHRHMSFDVQSMRYADFSEKAAIVPASLLSREERIERYPKVFQKSDGDHFSRHEGLVDLDEETRRWLRDRYVGYTESCFEFYEDAVEAGIPKEDARFLLPLGTPVNMTVTGNARTMMHVLNLRQKATAQWEIRELSERIADELEEWMPHTGQWWRDNGPMRISP